MSCNSQWATGLSTKLGDYLLSNYCPDFLLKCSDNSVPCHRLVLSLASDRLKETLHKDENRTDIVLELVSEQPQRVVVEFLQALYSGKLVVTKENYQVLYRISVLHEIDWIHEVMVRWVEGSIVQLFGLDFLKFVCCTAKAPASPYGNRTFIKLLDLFGFDEHFKKMELSGQNLDSGLLDLESAVVRKIMKFSRFESDLQKMKFVLGWLEGHESHTKEMLSVLVPSVDFVSILATDADQFLQIKETLLKICPPELETMVSQKVASTLSHKYVEFIQSGDMADELLSVNVNIFKFLMTTEGLKPEDTVHKVDFAIQWVQQHMEHFGETQNFVLENVNLNLLFAASSQLFNQLKVIFAPDNGQFPKFDTLFATFVEDISTSKKLQKLAGTERWKAFQCDEVLELMGKFLQELDGYVILGVFLAWMSGEVDRSGYDKSWEKLIKLLTSVDTVHPRFLEDIKRIKSWDLANENKILSAFPVSNNEFEIFFDGILPVKEAPTVGLEVELGMATFKRQAGQFTKGSRIMTFKSQNRVVRIGFDESRTPCLFKYQTGLTIKARRASQERAEDVTQLFVTIYGVLDNHFVNMPFTHPNKLEELITQSRVGNSEFRVVVIIKSG